MLFAKLLGLLRFMNAWKAEVDKGCDTPTSTCAKYLDDFVKYGQKGQQETEVDQKQMSSYQLEHIKLLENIGFADCSEDEDKDKAMCYMSQLASVAPTATKDGIVERLGCEGVASDELDKCKCKAISEAFKKWNKKPDTFAVASSSEMRHILSSNGKTNCTSSCGSCGGGCSGCGGGCGGCCGSCGGGCGSCCNNDCNKPQNATKTLYTWIPKNCPDSDIYNITRKEKCSYSCPKCYCECDELTGCRGPNGTTTIGTCDYNYLNASVLLPGPRGPRGERGGLTGPRGPRGEDSDPPLCKRTKGPRGTDGPEGPNGPKGYPGIMTLTGNITFTKCEIKRGLPGLPYHKDCGPNMCTCSKTLNNPGLGGPDGFPGIMGKRGPPGPAGPPGEAGGRGDDGIYGVRGTVGRGGIRGPRGVFNIVPGEVGPAGYVGPAGGPGIAGEFGPRGLDGPDGPRGPAGFTGIEGRLGDPGPRGPPGKEGPRGIYGRPGPRGVFPRVGICATPPETPFGGAQENAIYKANNHVFEKP